MVLTLVVSCSAFFPSPLKLCISVVKIFSLLIVTSVPFLFARLISARENNVFANHKLIAIGFVFTVWHGRFSNGCDLANYFEGFLAN